MLLKNRQGKPGTFYRHIFCICGKRITPMNWFQILKKSSGTKSGCGSSNRQLKISMKHRLLEVFFYKIAENKFGVEVNKKSRLFFSLPSERLSFRNFFSKLRLIAFYFSIFILTAGTATFFNNVRYRKKFLEAKMHGQFSTSSFRHVHRRLTQCST